MAVFVFKWIYYHELLGHKVCSNIVFIFFMALVGWESEYYSDLSFVRAQWLINLTHILDKFVSWINLMFSSV